MKIRSVALELYEYGGRTELFNPLNAELNPICHLLALLGVHHFLHVSRIRVNRHFLKMRMRRNLGHV
jgi:hypothetical protein